MKTVLFEIVAAGHELVGYADGEFALQAREEAATEAMRHAIKGVAEAAVPAKVDGQFPAALSCRDPPGLVALGRAPRPMGCRRSHRDDPGIAIALPRGI